MISALILIIIIIFLPPVGVIICAGCGADFLVNLILTLLGGIPGHIHAFYIAWAYYSQKEKAERGEPLGEVPGVFSSKVKTGGVSESHYVKAQKNNYHAAPAAAPVSSHHHQQQGYQQDGYQQQGYQQPGVAQQGYRDGQQGYVDEPRMKAA